MKFLEKNLEDIIWQNVNTEEGRMLLAERGLNIPGITYRQVSFGSYGTADLVNFYITNSLQEKCAYYRVFTIYELKKEKVGIEAVMQAHRYKTALLQHLEKVQSSRPFDDIVRVVVIGSSIDSNSDFTFLYNYLFDTEIYLYDYKIDGIHFDLQERNWHQINESMNDDIISLLKTRASLSGLKKVYIKRQQTELQF